MTVRTPARGRPWILLLIGFAVLPAWARAQQPAAKWYDRIAFRGDFRLRSESFFQEDAPERTRPRIRLRLGLTAPLGDGFTLGVGVATGDPQNITSNNVSLGDVFESKDFTLYRAYLTWAPHPKLELTGGKFGLLTSRPKGLMAIEQPFDEDLSPEGFHQTATLVSSPDRLVRRLVVLGDQWILQEVGAGDDSWMLGGQAALELGLGRRTSLGLSGAYYGFVHGRVLAQARNDNGELLVTNGVITRSGALVAGGAPLKPAAADPFDRFQNDFRLVQGAVGITRSGVHGQDLSGSVTWVHNTAADDANDAVWASLSYGTLRRRGDWGAVVTWARTEQEAVLSLFNFSDHGRGGTNVEGPIFQVSYRATPALTVQAKHHVMSLIRDVPGVNGHALHRLQVDARVTF